MISLSAGVFFGCISLEITRSHSHRVSAIDEPNWLLYGQFYNPWTAPSFDTYLGVCGNAVYLNLVDRFHAELLVHQNAGHDSIAVGW